MSTTKGPTCKERLTNTPVRVQPPLSSRALASGGATTQPGLPLGHRTPSPHGRGYSKRNLESATDTPRRFPDTGPSFHPHPGPYPEHLRVPKVRFILKDNTSIVPSLPPHWPLPECSAGPAFNTVPPKSLRLYPKGLLLQLPLLHHLRCPEHRVLSAPSPHALHPPGRTPHPPGRTLSSSRLRPRAGAPKN